MSHPGAERPDRLPRLRRVPHPGPHTAKEQPGAGLLVGKAQRPFQTGLRLGQRIRPFQPYRQVLPEQVIAGFQSHSGPKDGHGFRLLILPAQTHSETSQSLRGRCPWLQRRGPPVDELGDLLGIGQLEHGRFHDCCLPQDSGKKI